LKIKELRRRAGLQIRSANFQKSLSRVGGLFLF